MAYMKKMLVLDKGIGQSVAGVRVGGKEFT